MSKCYKATIIMNDGTKTGTLSCESVGEARHKIAMQLKLTSRYYKKDGVDYGPYGKVFTYEEIHGGLKEAYIVEWTATNKIPY